VSPDVPPVSALVPELPDALPPVLTPPVSVPEAPPVVAESPPGSKKSMSLELEQAATRASAPKSVRLL
jgi:hypothetical protein